ncbi:MAG: photosynthetic reaction center subunit H [Pseudomonadota bacterium]
MIFGGEFVAGIDLVDVCLWLFTIFFLGLCAYLQRESMREGYPAEQEKSSRPGTTTPFFPPTPKTFKQPHGRADISMTYGPTDTRELALKPTANFVGAPFVPTGDNPLLDGVGPGAYAMREDIPDLTMEGAPRIAPFRDSPDFEVRPGDTDPRGLDVIGLDGEVGGKVVDLWVDRSEAIIRYFEVEVALQEDKTKRVLLPVPFAVVKGGRKPCVTVHAIKGEHFALAPTTKNELSVTRLEEDKISGFYGAGTLYATHERQEPLL